MSRVTYQLVTPINWLHGIYTNNIPLSLKSITHVLNIISLHIVMTLMLG
jgi:hypothetical protein